MGYIENLIEFRIYLDRSEKFTSGSKSSIVSRLNFLSDQGINIDSNLLNNDVIGQRLLTAEGDRTKYTSEDGYNSLTSALNTYRSFLNSDLTSISDDMDAIDSDSSTSKTEKNELRKARIGQGKFRDKLIKLWKKCAVSGFSKPEFLIASHILPWKDSTNSERLNEFNGLLLLPNYDKLFDRGYISFENNGNIILSRKLSTDDYRISGISPVDALHTVNSDNVYFLECHRTINSEFLY